LAIFSPESSSLLDKQTTQIFAVKLPAVKLNNAKAIARSVSFKPDDSGRFRGVLHLQVLIPGELSHREFWDFCAHRNGLFICNFLIKSRVSSGQRGEIASSGMFSAAFSFRETIYYAEQEELACISAAL
jgi:hypothetical protein